MRGIAYGLLALLLVCAAGVPLQAAGPADCMRAYARTHDPACVDQVLAAVRPSPSAKPGQETMFMQSVVGFLAEILASSPQERRRVQTLPLSPLAREACAEALWRAGQRDEALACLRAGGLAEVARRLTAANPPVLATVRPQMNPSDNDLLIGAYMASGDVRRLRPLLENFGGASDGMAADAFRISHFVGRRDPGDRPGSPTKAACERYDCRRDMRTFLRVLTMASAAWALEDIGRGDAAVARFSEGYYAADARLLRLRDAERQTFANYSTLRLVWSSGVRSEPDVEAYLSGYENLMPAKELFERFRNSRMFQKKQ